MFHKKEEKKDLSRIEKELLKKEENEIESWKIFQILSELVRGFRLLRKYNKGITIFGSARTKPEESAYQKTVELGKNLAEKGFTVISGGGGGIMEAANKGAYEAGGDSVGINIKLPEEQQLNDYVTDSQDFDHFFVRKVMFSFASNAYIFMPGGFGTLDEFFEMIMLIQTKKIDPLPVILVGDDYWRPLLDWIRHTLYEERGTISEVDMDIYKLVDSPEEAVNLVEELVNTNNNS